MKKTDLSASLSMQDDINTFKPEELEEVLPSALPEAPMSIHIDSYYKGFHVGFTKRMDEHQITPQIDGVTAVIEKLILKGYKPSWNEETNLKVNGGAKYACKECGAPATFKSGKSSKGKPWKGVFCSKDSEHVTWLRDEEQP